MGSLIHYFAVEYNKNYFTILNIAFYGVGLPITYLQKRADNYYDALYGSKWTFKSRIHACFIIQICCLIIAPFAGYYGLVLVSMIIGCATWVAHSCTTSLSGMVKFNSSIMQQIGFALPAVFGIITSLVFNLSADDVPDINIILFFWSIALFVVPGIITWHFMHKSHIVREKLLAKDFNLGHLLIESALQKSNHDLASLTEEPVESPLYNDYTDDDEGRGTEVMIRDSSEVSPRESNRVRSSDIFVPNGKIDEKSFLLDSPHTSQRMMMDSRQFLLDDKSLIQDVMRSNKCNEVLKPYRWTLFITIFASILQGSFISYTFGCVLFGKTELPSILYFVRIFSDLFGRPLGLLKRPSMVSDVHGLLRFSIARMLVSIYFYTIIVNLFYPADFVHSDYCHLILIGFQVFFSASSGYLNSLTYEYASAAFDNEWSRVIAAQQLNLTFQKACTCAVFVALCVLIFVDVIKPALGIDFNTV